jgi:hypothetical protein
MAKPGAHCDLFSGPSAAIPDRREYLDEILGIADLVGWWNGDYL